MKVLQKLAFAWVLAVVVTGCSKRDDTEGDNNSLADLVGTWQVTGEQVLGNNKELDAVDRKAK